MFACLACIDLMEPPCPLHLGEWSHEWRHRWEVGQESKPHTDAQTDVGQECSIYGPGEIRTHDLLLRRQALYPAELRARCIEHE